MKLSDNSAKTKTTCTRTGYAWVSTGGQEYTTAPAACILNLNDFLMGATTNVSDLKSFFSIDSEGRIGETGISIDNCTVI